MDRTDTAAFILAPLLAVLLVAICSAIIDVRRRLKARRAEKIEQQRTIVYAWEDHIDCWESAGDGHSSYMPEFRKKLEQERAKLARMEAK